MKLTLTALLILAAVASVALEDHCGYCSRDEMKRSCSCIDGELPEQISYPGSNGFFYCCRKLLSSSSNEGNPPSHRRTPPPTRERFRPSQERNLPTKNETSSNPPNPTTSSDHCGYCSRDDMKRSCTCLDGELSAQISYPGSAGFYYCCRLPKVTPHPF